MFFQHTQRDSTEVSAVVRRREEYVVEDLLDVREIDNGELEFLTK